jgi:cytochrome c oxidase subunit 2
VKSLLWPAALVLAGCASHQQSAVNVAGGPAAGIERLWWLFFWLLLAIFVVVMIFVAGTLARRRRGIEQEPLEPTHIPSPETEKRLTSMVVWASSATVLILMALIVVSVSAGKAILTTGSMKPALTIEVVGNQWWWYIRYLDDDASRIVVTANEIHIPVGKPVLIRGTSQDVIHSFWVPNLQGKRDLIPNRITTEWLQADQPGRYRGQCAEFCGLQHAHMSLWVVAESQHDFDAWMDGQRQPAVAPSDSVQLRGQQVFLNSACVFCHSIAGTSAAGQVAPDLTHFGTRLTIAAGTLANNRGNLGGWITDPQGIKPGNHMATVPIKPDDLQTLVEYLESLR